MGRYTLRQVNEGIMASNTATIHITIDDMRFAFDAINEHIVELGKVCASQSAELDRQRVRIQRLESLPGVAEALAAAQQDEGV